MSSTAKPRSGKAAAAPDAVATVEDEARRSALWSAVEDGHAALRRAWRLPLLDGHGCRKDPTSHHHHRETMKGLAITGPPADQWACPALCGPVCGRGPGTLAAVAGERCAMHEGGKCGDATADRLEPVVPCPRYTPGLRELAARFGEFTHRDAGLALVADGLLLYDPRASEWVGPDDAPIAVLRDRAPALRAFLERALAAYEVRAAGEAAAAAAAERDVIIADALVQFRRTPPEV